jgi:cytochrome c oxidase subunit 2
MRRIDGLWWLMAWICVVVFAFVAGMLVWSVVRGRRRSEDDARAPARWGEPFIVIAGVGASAVVLISVFLVSLHEMGALAAQGDATAMSMRVIGHDWWWEAQYDNGAVTANELHIPAGVRVRLHLQTADVIHSFWVPQLAPKRDMIPGRTNDLWIEADAPGRYRGQCAEYCGLQHAHMALWVVAQRAPDFDAWLRDQAQPARAPSSALAAHGRDVFLNTTCVGCHAIRGTAATGKLGPDLTHLGSRATIAGGTLPNAPDSLAAWIVDPQDAKPGVSMPPTQLAADDLRAIVAYLQDLR